MASILPPLTQTHSPSITSMPNTIAQPSPSLVSHAASFPNQLLRDITMGNSLPSKPLADCRGLAMEPARIYPRPVSHSLGKRHASRPSPPTLLLASRTTAMGTDPHAPFHFPTLESPGDCCFQLTKAGNDTWLLRDPNESSSHPPTNLYPGNHMLFKKRHKPLHPKYRDKRRRTKLLASQWVHDVGPAGFLRGRGSQLQPVISYDFKPPRPKRQMTMMIRGLKISLYHLHKEIFPDTSMELYFETISPDDNNELIC
ncbi:hypothetical protein AAC387_Pa01g2621 [Persea americana]